MRTAVGVSVWVLLALGTIHSVSQGIADVDAGVTWSTLAMRALESGQTLPVYNDFAHLSIGQLASVLRGRTPLHRALRQRLRNGDWFVDTFPTVLGEVAGVRNPAAHRSRTDADTAIRLRNRLMGVGDRGILVELTRVQPGT